MAKTFRPFVPEQTFLFPPSLLEFVPADHPAHFVRNLVCESLDLSEIYAAYFEERGFPPYHPAMMTALLLYAYSLGIYSSRRIARACVDRVDFFAATGMQKPDFRTISDFRKRHLKSLENLFVQVLELCREAGLVSLGHVALDGTKVQANASKRKAMSYKRMNERERELSAKVSKWLADAEAVDAAEDEELGDKRGDELPDWVANDKARLEKIRAAKAALEAEAKANADEEKERAEKDPKAPRVDHSKKWWTKDGKVKPKAQRNFTDPQSRIMKSSDGFLQGYNGQIAVDSKAQIIVAHHLLNEQTDMTSLPILLAQIKANTGRQAREISADSGYCSEANLGECARRGINAFIAIGRQQHGKPVPESGRAAPEPESRRGRMLAKLRRAGYRSRYRMRKKTVEPVFGQMKEARRFRRFLLRGLEKVRSEWSLICTAHNLAKLATFA